jgi:hypothetical protein
VNQRCRIVVTRRVTFRLIRRIGLVGRRSWNFISVAQSRSEVLESPTVLVVFPLDDSFNRVGRVLVSLRGCLQLRVDVVYACLDIGLDRVFCIPNVARGLIAPTDSVSKLLLVILHRLQVGPGFGVRGASPPANPDMVAVKDGCLVRCPPINGARKHRQHLA